MSLRIIATCAMCGAASTQLMRLLPVSSDVRIDECAETGVRGIRDALEEFGWVVQFNGPNIDVYCSLACAE
ncbi:MAG: hypothetical protein IPH13_20345 [Planctomycetes bacterium]|nr:hypothetical protein [Planctomycetota bacterium]